MLNLKTVSDCLVLKAFNMFNCKFKVIAKFWVDNWRNNTFDVSKAAFPNMGLKLPCGSKKRQEGGTVPTTAQVAHSEGVSLRSLGAVIRSS